MALPAHLDSGLKVKLRLSTDQARAEDKPKGGGCQITGDCSLQDGVHHKKLIRWLLQRPRNFVCAENNGAVIEGRLIKKLKIHEYL